MSVSQYAQLEGITVQAAYARIRNGQLADAVVHHGGRYLINPARAAVSWAQRSRPCNSRAFQLEQRLLLLPDQLAGELAGMDATYCRVALTRAIIDMLDSTEAL